MRDKTVFISGASRGIGREIALRCAREGANIVVTGKTVQPHPKLSGTILSVADEVELAGGRALPLQLDVRDEVSVAQAIELAVRHFGGLDMLVNNASAIKVSPTMETSAKALDLMWQVNARATFLLSQACVPHLRRAANPHILNLSPPLNLDAKWLAPHLAYTMSKYGMSLCTLGMAREFADAGIAVNSLWPRTVIATAAIEFNFPREMLQAARHPAIVAEAACRILHRNSRICTGRFFTDEEVLREEGMQDFSVYAVDNTKQLIEDFFLG